MVEPKIINENENKNVVEKIDKIFKQSLLSTYQLFNYNESPTTPITTTTTTSATTTTTTNSNNNNNTNINDDDESKRIRIYSKIKDEYYAVKDLPPPQFKKPAASKQTTTGTASSASSANSTLNKPTIEEVEVDKSFDNIIKSLPQQQDEKRRKIETNNNQLSIYNEPIKKENINIRSLNLYEPLNYSKPEWHPPWKLMRVISGHTGWVRTVAVDPSNEWFATGSTDNTIKIWDLASGELKVTLTGHVSAIRDIKISSKHPYLFSVAEDNKVLCWDLETNRQVKNYYGHKSGVYSIALHPTLDVLFTGGRDKVVRVWDMRTKAQIFEMKGHRDVVNTLVSQNADPQVVSGSSDSTVKLWDLATGTSAATLTNHKKGVRALVMHNKDYSFASGSADNIKQWKCPDGSFIKNFSGHNAIINSMALNEDNVMVSGADNGSMNFWDWKTGYCFQKLQTIVQPGSLDSEAGIFSMTFDKTGSRLITGEADKTIKFYKEDEDATPSTHPVVDWKPSKNDRY